MILSSIPIEIYKCFGELWSRFFLSFFFFFSFFLKTRLPASSEKLFFFFSFSTRANASIIRYYYREASIIFISPDIRNCIFFFYIYIYTWCMLSCVFYLSFPTKCPFKLFENSWRLNRRFKRPSIKGSEHQRKFSTFERRPPLYRERIEIYLLFIYFFSSHYLITLNK